ncbi:MAG: type II toxin-antitoxin system PemK/MazF family toxin [Myxococcales bacterium]|nr:type II toxin-antitoxin system PemK/MazF family toxin [Myxococcales bacterium]
MLIIQADAFTKSAIATVMVAAVSTNTRLAASPGNVALTARQSGLPKDSVVNVSQILTVDRSFLTQRVRRLPPNKIQEVDLGLLRVLDLRGAGGI